jgi:quercetin dioxygenase-like cupin family protein
MHYLRIYSEKNGDSRFAETELTISEPDYQPPAPTLFVSHTYDASGLQFVRLPGGWTGEALHPPTPQFVICVDGHLEVTASDGEKRSIGPGGCLFMEDVHGKGHRSHVRPGHDCVIGVIAIH